jgi:hypothetical protein
MRQQRRGVDRVKPPAVDLERGPVSLERVTCLGDNLRRSGGKCPRSAALAGMDSGIRAR